MLEKVPLLVLSAASSWMTLKAQRAVVQSFEEFSFANRIENAVVAYGLYLWKMVWPAQLAFYPHSTGCTAGVAVASIRCGPDHRHRVRNLPSAASATCRLVGFGFWVRWFRSSAWCRWESMPWPIAMPTFR